MGTLASFEASAALAVLADLDDELGRREIQNVSGFLSGIMRRHSKQRAASAAPSEKAYAPGPSHSPPSTGAASNTGVGSAKEPASISVEKSLAERVEAYDEADDSDEELDKVSPNAYMNWYN